MDFLYIIHHYPMGNVLDQPVILDTLPEVVVLDLVGLTGHVVRLGCGAQRPPEGGQYQLNQSKLMITYGHT